MKRYPTDEAEISTLPINPAFLLIDMQVKFVGRLSPFNRKRIIEEQTKVIRFCAEEDLLLFVLEYNKYGPTVHELKCEIERVGQSCLILKNRNSGFLNTGLGDLLTDFKVDTLVPMGINAAACVWGTAHDALEIGYEVLTSETLMANGENVTRTRKWRQNIRASVRWYKHNTSFYPTADELISVIRKEMTTTA